MNVLVLHAFGLASACLLGCSEPAERSDAGRDAMPEVAAAETAKDVPVTVCAEDCPACQAGFACVKASTFGRLVPACLKVCNSTGDCAPTERCLVSNDGRPGRVGHCVSQDRPAFCTPVNDYAHCDFLGSHCLDASTLLKETSRFGAFCGWEKVACPAGCENADAGSTGLSRCR